MELKDIEANICGLLLRFSEVREVKIKPLESRYFRDYDRLIIPPKENNMLFYFIISHELGHKWNNKCLVWLFKATRLKFFYLWLEYDAFLKSKHLIDNSFKERYREFSMENLRSYLK